MEDLLDFQLGIAKAGGEFQGKSAFSRDDIIDVNKAAVIGSAQEGAYF